jgi:hypothetical protein
LFHATQWATACEVDPNGAQCAGGSGGTATNGSGGSTGSGATGSGGNPASSSGGGGVPAGVGGAGGGEPRDDHVTEGLLALYTFDEGGGTAVTDTSNAGAPLDLTIANAAAVEWLPGAVYVTQSTLIASAGPATKLIEGCQQTQEITLEVWFVPDTLAQGGPARLITNSADTTQRNFQLGQELGSFYQARLRSTATTVNGSPYVQTPTDGGDVQLALTHVLFTRDAGGVRRLYVDGTERATNTLGGDFSTWNPSFRLALVNELTLDRSWLGELHRVAVYGRALSGDEVTQNFQAGP